MKLVHNTILWIFLITLLFSCEQNESNDPIFESKTFNNTLEEQQQTDSFYFTYKFGDFEVDRIGQGVGSVPIIGGLLQRVTESFANIIISAEGGKDYSVEPTIFSIPELDDVDFSMIKEVTLESINLEASAQNKGERVDLSFIDDINISLVGSVPANTKALKKDSQEVPEEEVELLSLVEDKGDSLSNSGLLTLESKKNNLKNVIRNYRKFKVVTRLTLDSVPNEDMKLSGKVRFRLKVDPGF